MSNDDLDVYQGDQWFVVPDDGPEQAFKNPTRAHMALMSLDQPGTMDSFPASTGVRRTVAERGADGTITPMEVNA